MDRGVISAPLRLQRTKKGAMWSVNLNQYRNTHFQTLNNLKIQYKELVTPQIDTLTPFSQIKLSLFIYPADNRKFDVGNIGSIHEKFFLDALVELGKLPEDTYEYCPQTHYYFGGVDADNPRVEIHIEEVTPMFKINRPTRVPVEVEVSCEDIEQLLVKALAEQGIDAEVSVNGLDLEIKAYEAESKPAPAPKKKTTTRKKAAAKKAESKLDPEQAVIAAANSITPEETAAIKQEVEASKYEDIALDALDKAVAEKANDDDVPFELDDVSATTSVEQEQAALIEELFDEEESEAKEEKSEPKTTTTVADLFDFD